MTCCEVGNIVSHVLATWLGGFKNIPDTNLEIQNRIDVTVRKVTCDQCSFTRQVFELSFFDLILHYELYDEAGVVLSF